jgi:DNA mismatch repair protein MSH6
MEHMDMVDENNDENRVKTSRSKSANKKVKIQQQPPDTPKDVPGDQETDPLSQFTDATPQWAQREHCLDKQMRGPSHPFYDPTTLHIPESAWSKFTAPMKQFWRVKSDNFDKVVLFKLGKFYELFYDDAAVGNQYLDLKYMGTKMHTGFPEKCLERYAGELVQLGFKTVIVEQMETPEQMEARVKDDRKQGRKSEKTLNREITQVLTKGTFVSQEEPNESYLPTYLLALRMHGQSYGFALLEMGTNEIAMGMVEDLEKLKTVLYQTRPVELVYDPDNVNFEVCGMMEKTFLHMQMSKVPNIKNIWHPLHALGELGRLAAENKTQLPKIFEVIDQMPET